MHAVGVESHVPLYSELLPEQLDALWAKGAAAIVPWGALEWHGDHLPLGLDGIIASWFAEQLAQRIEGVLMPGMWLPMTTLPHHLSLQVRTETLRMLLDDLLSELYNSGARKVCLVTGHYAHGHQVEMSEAAMRAMDDHEGLLVFCAAPLELLADPNLLDHAARYETSQLLAIRPDLVHLERLSKNHISVIQSAVLGGDPMLGDAEEGHALLQGGLKTWEAWIHDSDRLSLEQDYKGVFDRYAGYIDAYYRGSWEEAIKAWWAEKGDSPI